MNIILTINKNNILSSIKSITGFTGKNIEGKIDNISVTDDEETIISDLIKKATTNIVGSLFLYSAILSDADISLTLPANYNNNATASAISLLENTIVNYASSSWFYIARLDKDAETYLNKAGSTLAELQDVLCSRNKPL